MPSQNMKPTSHDCRKVSQPRRKAPTMDSSEHITPTIRARLRILSMATGGAKSAGVTRTAVLMALHLPRWAGGRESQGHSWNWVESGFVLVAHLIDCGLQD